MKMGRFKHAPAMVLCLLAMGFAFSANAVADTASDLNAGIELLERGRTEEANAKFRAVLAADPSSEDAYQLVRSTDSKLILKMMVAGGDAEQIIKRLLALSHREELKRSQDEAAIKALVSEAVRGRDPAAARQAARKLSAEHGEYAVPALVTSLGSNDTGERTNAILALREIGMDAVPALAASLSIGSETQKHNAALLLKNMGDARSVPALKAAAGASGKDVAAAYVELAKAYFTGDPQTLKNYDGSYTVWSVADGKLQGSDVPGFMYQYELADQAAYDALSHDAGSADARAMIALCAFGELEAWDNLSDEAKANEQIAGAGQALSGARGLAASVGADDLGRAVTLGMKLGAGGAAGRAAKAIAGVWGGGAISADNALVKALGAKDKRARYGAAMALAHMNPTKAFPKSKMVAQILGEAAGEVSVKQVLVIDSDSKNGNNAQRALSEAGYHVLVFTTGTDGLRAAKATGAFDAVLVADSLGDLTTFQVLDEIGRDFRTSRMKKIVMATDTAKAGAEFAKYDLAGVSPTAADATGVVNAVSTALAGDAADMAQQRANAISIAASNAITHSAGSVFDLSAAQPGLLKAVGDTSPDDVRIAALRALSHVAKADAQGALSAVIARTENSAAVRSMAGHALARALRGSAPAPETFAALLAAMGDADASVSQAAGGAMGAAKLTDDQKLEVLRKQRI